MCDESFSPDHAMICCHGGLSFVCHNQIRDFTAEWLERVCHDVAIESLLQLLTGEIIVSAIANKQDDARVDIHARGFWHCQQSVFLM